MNFVYISLNLALHKRSFQLFGNGKTIWGIQNSKSAFLYQPRALPFLVFFFLASFPNITYTMKGGEPFRCIFYMIGTHDKYLLKELMGHLEGCLARVWWSEWFFFFFSSDTNKSIKENYFFSLVMISK